MKRYILTIRFFLWLAVLAGVLFFLIKGLAPGGEVVYSTDFQKKKHFFSKLSPQERLETEEGGEIKIIGNPVYFNIATPRSYNRAELSFKYKNQGNTEVGAGVLVDGKLWRYQVKPLENQIIEDLLGKWSFLKEGGLVLLQKEPKYNSLREFRQNPPAREKLAVYNHDPDFSFVLKDYTPTSTVQKIDTPLRGNYQFFTYIKNEPLDFSFVFQDLNQNKDPDPIDLNLYFQDKIILSKHLDDDGIETDSGEIGHPGKIKLKASDLPEGLYKIELRAGDDIVTQEIKSRQKVISFANKIRLFNPLGEQNKIYTDSRQIRAKIIDPANLQTIKISTPDDTTIQEFTIPQTYKQFEASLPNNEVKVLEMDKGGIIISGDGVFSFSPRSLLNPGYPKPSPELEKQGIDYVLARYNQPQKEGEWSEAKAGFDLTSAYREEGKYGFMISVPGLKAGESSDKALFIKEVKIKLTGKSWVEKVKEIF